MNKSKRIKKESCNFVYDLQSPIVILIHFAILGLFMIKIMYLHIF